LTTNSHHLPQQLVLLPTGAGEPQILTHDAIDHQQAWFFPEGKRILFTGSEPSHSRRGYVMELGSPNASPRAVTPEGVVPLPLDPISPDGKFFIARDIRNRKAFLFPETGGEPKAMEGIEPRETIAGWTLDGRSVYVMKGGEFPTTVTRVELSTGKREIWKEFVPPDPAGFRSIGLVRVARDGKAYVYLYIRFLSDLYLVENLE